MLFQTNIKSGKKFIRLPCQVMCPFTGPAWKKQFFYGCSMCELTRNADPCMKNSMQGSTSEHFESGTDFTDRLIIPGILWHFPGKICIDYRLGDRKKKIPFRY
jgi:hypothetical protein